MTDKYSRGLVTEHLLAKVSMNDEKLAAKLATLPADEILIKLDLHVSKEGPSLKIRCFNKDAHKNGDATPSLSVDVKTHKYHCFVCGVGGSNIVSLLSRLFKRSRERLMEFVCHRVFHQVVSESVVTAAQNRLLNTSNGAEYLDHLLSKRGISKKVIETYKIGVDESGRITIPIDGPFGFYCDLRRWDALRKDSRPHAPKYLPYDSDVYGKQSYGTLWPVSVIDKRDDIILCEGEGDTLRALSADAGAVTVVGGVGAFIKNPSLDLKLVGKSLTVCMDNDEAGRKATASIVSNTKQSGVSKFRVLRVPDPHKDLTDWLQASEPDSMTKTLETLGWSVAQSSTPVEHQDGVEQETQVANLQAVEDVSLSNIVRPEAVRTSLSFIGQVASVAMQPFLVPHRFRVSCQGDRGDECSKCPNSHQNLNGLYEVQLADDAYVDCIDQKDVVVRKRLSAHAGIPQVCRYGISIIDTHPALPIKLIPGAHRPGRDVTTEHVTRDAIYSGHYLMAGITSKFKGYTRPHPETQRAITVVTETTSGVRAWDGYSIPEYIASDLRNLFRGKHPYESLYWLADQLGTYYTRVAGRQLLHVVSDIAFHSILEIPVGGKLQNGFMDVLIVGETTCGKGACVEGMVQTYGAGEVVSGKRCTIAGLIGGTVRHSGGFDLSIGVWALRDGEIVIMDEKTHPSVFSTMTRPRREGVAEFTQAGITHRAMARVRKIWIQNPPSGKTMLDYPFGVEVLKELVPAAEDVARWDMVVGVLSDVSDDAIIQASLPIRSKPKISRDHLRAKLMWAWSRRHNNINFHKSARDAVSKFTKEVNRDYVHPGLGLVQSGSTHIRLRKGAAAIAAATFSTEGQDLDLVHVTGEHVEAFVNVLRDSFDAPALRLSEMCRIHNKATYDQLKALIRKLIKTSVDQDFISVMLRQAPSNRRTWEAFSPSSVNGANFVDEMIRCRGLVSDDGGMTMRLSPEAVKAFELANKQTVKETV